MADGSHIEWTDATWNPVTGCSVVSPGCTNCYAMKLAGTRLKHHPSRAGLTVDSKAGPVWNGEVRFNAQWLDQPLRWTRPRMIFVCAHGDLFHESVPEDWIDRVFAVMALGHHHTFQVLTKRSARMRDYVSGFTCDGARRFNVADAAGRLMEDGDNAHDYVANMAWPLPNVWLGVSAEDQRRADERIPDLLATPAVVRFLSAEPMLGQLDVRQWQHAYGCGCGWGGDNPLDYCNNCGWRGDAGAEPDRCPECATELSDYNACPECDGYDGDGMSFGPNSRPGLDWVIAGGESGRGARPMHPDWARSLRDQCTAAGVPFFFKQWGNWGEFFDLGEPRAPQAFIDIDGNVKRDPTKADLRRNLEQMQAGHDGWALMSHVGKKAAGRMLDGVDHNAMPERRP